jgi:hypothetical protein
MWEIKITPVQNKINISILLNKTIILTEKYLSVHIENKKSVLFIGNVYDENDYSYTWEFIESMYKEFVLYRKYKNIDDLNLDKDHIMRRYYSDAIIPIKFSEKLVDNVIFEIENMCKYINNSPFYKYKNFFII